jgi:hypothetical protein
MTDSENTSLAVQTPHWMTEAIKANCDAEQIERLGAAYREHEKFQAERAYTAAMTLAQAEMKPIQKNRKNAHLGTTYADLEAVLQAILPVATKHGFSLSFGSVAAQTPGNVNVRCECRHKGGHCTEHFLELPPDGAGLKGGGNKTGVQAVGSTISYGRRYLTLMIFNLATSDDDDGGDKGGNLIDEEQLGELMSLWNEAIRAGCKLNMELACKWLGVAKFADLDQQGYKKAVNDLKAKIAARGK